MHDYEHGGLTNDFLVNSLDSLAVRYNDRSPLENHHLASGFGLLRSPEFNFAPGLAKADFERFRKVRARLARLGAAALCQRHATPQQPRL